jgi:nucleoside 2-deoxyribosyltransferase
VKIYLAGPLFTQAERAFNVAVKQLLRGYDFDVFLPQEAVKQTPDSKDALRKIFYADLAGLAWCDWVVAVLDGSDVDSGTAWECGYAYGRGKPVFGLRIDFRKYSEHEDVNLMISECLTQPMYKDFIELAEGLVEYRNRRA